MLRPLTLILPLLADACIETSPPTEAPAPGIPAASCSDPEIDLASFVGRRPEDIGADRLGFPVRVIAPGMAVTMDYSPARLNLETDAAGVISRAYCG